MGTEVRNLNHGQLIIKDGGGSAEQSVTVPIEVGNLSWTVVKENHEIHDRNTLLPFAEGRQKPMPVSFTIAYEAWLGDDSADETTPVDALLQKGEAVDWESVESSGPYAVDLEFRITSPGSSKSEKVILPKFHVDEIKVTEDEDFTKIEVSGMCRAVEPTVTRVSSF